MEAETIEDRQERAARNESLFREVNERLEEIGKLSMFHEFICECTTPDCTDHMSMTHDEYERVRAHPARFAVLPGHVLSDVEAIVDSAASPRYVVVEKIEKAAELAAEFDPRGTG